MTTWLSPYASVWHQQYPQAALPFKQLARYCKPLEKLHSPVARPVVEYLTPGGRLRFKETP